MFYFITIFLFVLILASFAGIDGQNPLESLALPVIWNQNQNICNEIGRTCSCIVQFCKICFFKLLVGLSK